MRVLLPFELFVKPTTFVDDIESPICATRSGHGQFEAACRRAGDGAYQA